MLNKIILTGNVGRNPEIKVTQQNRKIATFYLATSSSWKDEDGEWQIHTDWHHIVVLRESTVNWLQDILKKGDKIYLEGKLSYQYWTDNYNQKRSTPHVVVDGPYGRLEYLRSSRSLSQKEGLSSENTLDNSKDQQIEDNPKEVPSQLSNGSTLPTSNINSQTSQQQ